MIHIFKYLVDSYAVDWWTLGHFFGWFCGGVLLAIFIGVANPWLSNHELMIPVVLTGMMLGFGWEMVELLAVEPLAGWHEPWLNRFVFDPLANLTGLLTATWMIKNA